jgi:hypothetical protein
MLGVEIEQNRFAVVVVEVEAISKEEAQRMAVDKVAKICPRAANQRELGLVDDGWFDGGGFTCVGPNRDEDWSSGDHEPNIRM